MTPQQIQIIQKSWRQLRDLPAGRLGDLFYSRLFFDHPEVRRMFPKDMAEQHEKLVQMLRILVARLENLGDLADEIGAMGRRHQGYGAKPQHYQAVKIAMLWTLSTSLGEDWTADTQAAWSECFDVLTHEMLVA